LSSAYSNRRSGSGEHVDTPEVKKKRAPIHLVLGNHSDSSVDNLVHLDTAIGESLRKNPSGNVVVFVEDGYALAAQAEVIEQQVAQGYPPSLSFGILEFVNYQLRFPDPTNTKDVNQVMGALAETNKFRLAELKILDKHADQSGRVRLLWEARPNEEAIQEVTAGTFNRGERYTEAEDESVEAVLVGEFDRGLAVFKPSVEELARDTSKRNDRFAARIATVAEDPDVAAVAGYIGGAHTRLGHILVRKGYDVTRVFPEMENGVLSWGTSVEAIRQREFFPDGALSEVDWHRLMIGVAIQRSIDLLVYAAEEQTGDTMSLKEVLRLTRIGLSGFTDMESIRQFERSVKEKDFMEALIDLSK